ncbi:MAG: thioredoxin family protein [Candidatus Onthomonas sp.]
MAEHLNEDSFQAYLEASALPVLVDFYKDGCVPCRRVAPLVSKAEAEYEGQLAIARVNISTNPALAAREQIGAAPTLVLYWNGREKARHRGVINRDGLKTLIEENL